MQNPQKPEEPQSFDYLTIRIGKWFEASAKGKLAIAAVSSILVGLFIIQIIGLLWN